MAVNSGRPIVAWEPPAMIERLEEAIDDVMDEDLLGMTSDDEEGFKITLEDELIQIYNFQTLLKANDANLEEHRMTYNMACKAAEQRGDGERVSELIDIRFNARRQGMENTPIELLVSPYTDEGAAICYGYIEGALELVRETESRREQFERDFVTIKNIDGSIKVVRRG